MITGISVVPHLRCLYTPAVCISLSVRTTPLIQQYDGRSFSEKTIIRWPKNFPGHRKSKFSKPNDWKDKVFQRSRPPGQSKVLSKDKVAKHLTPLDNCNDAGQKLGADDAIIDTFLQKQPENDHVKNEDVHFPDSDLGLSGTFIIGAKNGDRVVEDLKVSSFSLESDRLLETSEGFGPEEIQRRSKEIENQKNNEYLISGFQEKNDQNYSGKRITRHVQARNDFVSRENLCNGGEGEMETEGQLQEEFDEIHSSRFPETRGSTNASRTNASRTTKGSPQKISNQSYYKRKPKIGLNHEVLYGVSPCLLALKQDRRQILKAFTLEAFQVSARNEAQEIVRLLGEKGVDLHRMSRGDMNKLSQGRPHQGVCLEVSPLHFEHLSKISSELMTMPVDRPVCVLALDQILDPMNLGALMRSAYFLGVDKIVASKYKCCPLTPTVSKASSGTTEIMPIYSAANMASFLQELASLGWLIIGATNKEGGPSVDHAVPVLPCRDIQITSPTVLVIGSEGFGLREDLQSHCHQLVTIPAGRHLHSNIDSLNVSVATGIILHALLVKR